jgi:hypothetical protein
VNNLKIPLINPCVYIPSTPVEYMLHPLCNCLKIAHPLYLVQSGVDVVVPTLVRERCCFLGTISLMGFALTCKVIVENTKRQFVTVVIPKG